jgi:glycosyltransferase involved in cell wall biosynthesis
MKNTKLLVSYYEDAWIDLDVLPYKEYDYFLIVPFQRPKPGLDLSGCRTYVSFQAKRSTALMKLLHGLKFTLFLPLLLRRYDEFLLIVPPYFHALAMPFLKFFGKHTASIAGDAYSEIAWERLWQSSWLKRFLRKLSFPFTTALEYLGVTLSDRLFVVSRYLLKKYLRWGCTPTHVPNGADVAAIAAIRPSRIVPEDYVFYFGGLLKWRGIDLLLHAFAEVKKRYTRPLKLVLVGGDQEQLKHYPEVRQLAAKLGDAVVMTGFLPHEQAIAALKGARIAVLPNRNTLMSRTISSIKVFEYIAAEVPQVCTDSGDHAAWVRKLKAGVVVKDTAQDIAKGILQLLNPKSQKRIRRNCAKNKHLVDYRVQRKALSVLA